ncbi:MAG: metalloregulator ArsR/SmtB family transcription factor [Candidatus Moranbacteria bacterium]|nr:metalloregulator ArsR/SmtB family transcription factor [Candidatus Moranbacteria bacterium]MDD3965245.1 metalloregulator ArsR/SmtB family transcription factor [Candidatus Moranbacteria bacterium]
MLTKEELMRVKQEMAKNDNRTQLIFEALGDPGRFRIFRLLMDYKELCVTEVAAIFDITVSAVSQQLKILERVGLVYRVKTGQMVCYEIKDEKEVQRMVQLLKVDKK